MVCSGGGVRGIEKAAVLGVLGGLRDPTEDSDLISLSSSLLQLTSTDGPWITTHVSLCIEHLVFVYECCSITV